MLEPFNYMLVPIDFSKHSLRALDVADGLARGLKGELHLVHVMDWSPFEFYGTQGIIPPLPIIPAFEGGPIDAELAKKELVARLGQLAGEKRGGPCTYEVRMGNPVSEILAAAAERRCSGIVICTHGRTGLPHFIMGSVAERIVRMSPIPVLSVRAVGLE